VIRHETAGRWAAAIEKPVPEREDHDIGGPDIDGVDQKRALCASRSLVSFRSVLVHEPINLPSGRLARVRS
jgi:hypothetical protein